MSGEVFVDGRREYKPGAQIRDGCVVEYRGGGRKYVSRGGLKLEKALEFFKVCPEGRVCLDCGASTGGFTDCLLKAGAARVYAVDVGYGQFAWSLRNDARVTLMERTNIRNVTPDMIPEPISLATADVSFISLSLVLPRVRELMSADGEVICLVKPQFEAGRGKVGKNGVVRDGRIHAEVLAGFMEGAAGAGFAPRGLTFSPVKGPRGNIEYLALLSVLARGDASGDVSGGARGEPGGTLAGAGGGPEFDLRDIDGVVSRAHAQLG
jgi:23S rRNA (cytidine1920-2'-O)/16S rRNA (cytidine1409-2'-O)-methyltransferase